MKRKSMICLRLHNYYMSEVYIIEGDGIKPKKHIYLPHRHRLQCGDSRREERVGAWVEVGGRVWY